MPTTENTISGVAMISSKVYLVLIISISLLSQLTLSALGESSGTGMNVKDEPQNTLWWLKGQPRAEDNPPDLMATTDRLTSLIFDDKRADLRAVYGNCYVNPGNSTLFVVLTRCDSETTAMFNTALDPPPSVHIVYRTGPATYEELEGYMNSISNIAFSLPRDVVEVNGMEITENATILIGIGYVTPEAVGALAKAIRGLAPEGLIFVRRMGAAVLTSEAMPILASVPANSSVTSTGNSPKVPQAVTGSAPANANTSTPLASSVGTLPDSAGPAPTGYEILVDSVLLVVILVLISVGMLWKRSSRSQKTK
jgi:hypothetical protein